MSIAEDILKHYGMPHVGGRSRSGRYPWGSGDNPYQHDDWFDSAGGWLTRVKQYEKAGWTQKKLAEHFNLGAVEFRSYRAIAVRESKLELGKTIKDMVDNGMSYTDIGKALNLNESSVRSKLNWYNKEQEPDAKSARYIADYLKDAITELGGSVDVGEGVARKLGISNERLEQALTLMENEGYSYKVGMMDRATDPTSNNKIIMKVVGEGQLPDHYIRDYIEEIHSLNELKTTLTEDGTKVRPSFVFPESMDISRLKIIHGDEDGLDPGIKGADRDGLVEIRRGLKDLDLGESNYAQVRILVDGDRYIKGMAVYRDPADMPDGIDVVWNTNKPSTKADRDILKKVQMDENGNVDSDNPFGSLIRQEKGQTYYDDPNGKFVDPVTGEHQSLNLINKTRIEGDWGEWADKVPSQMLSKQSKKLVEYQLQNSIKERQLELDEIMSITNPTIRKDQLLQFADSCETNSTTLKAAAFPGQKYQVILPLPTVKDTEIYAPNYENGSQVALIRYPHGGTFEIPILTVNNKNAEGKRVMTATPMDAVGISPAVAQRLSGADYDGDTVQVIPMSDRVNIHNSRPLPGLVDFDPHVEYAIKDKDDPGIRRMKYETRDPKTGRKKTIDHTQDEMGKITNLISDMTLLGATREELERAVKHSMVVIDAAKHGLDYKRSEIDNGIPELKKLYQGKINPATGRLITPAATVVSRAGAQASEPKTVGQGYIDKETGKIIYKIDDRPNAKGKQRMQKTKQMLTVDDAFDLVHNNENPIEIAYATYANQLKRYTDDARKEAANIKETRRDPQAARIYEEEVKSLKAKLEKSQSNQDIERWAQLTTNQRIKAAKQKDPYLADDKSRLKKLRQQYLTRAREETGAKRVPIDITDKEWEAIQRGAVGHTTLTAIIKYANPDRVRALSMPHDKRGLTSQQQQLAKLLQTQGASQQQIANRLGVSTSTINDVLSGKGG